jgi:hypothetical protein
MPPRVSPLLNIGFKALRVGLLIPVGFVVNAYCAAGSASSGGSISTKSVPSSSTGAVTLPSSLVEVAAPISPSSKLRVGVLGATGAVGQRFLQLLENHPWFEVVALGASDRSFGKKYEAATTWQVSSDIPAFVLGQKLTSCDPVAMPNVDVVFSALVRFAMCLERTCGPESVATL